MTETLKKIIRIILLLSLVQLCGCFQILTQQKSRSKPIWTNKKYTIVPILCEASNHNDNTVLSDSQQSLLTILSLAGFTGYIFYIRMFDMCPLIVLSLKLETSYLSWSKLSATQISGLCSEGQSCNDVLNGPFSMIPFVNVPIALLAALGYAAVAGLSSPLLLSMLPVSQEKAKEVIVFLSTCMATFSGYLMLLLTYVLQSRCNYCYLSAAISTALAAVSLSSPTLIPNNQKKVAIAFTSMALTSVSSIFLFYATSVLTVTESVQASTAPAAQILAMEAEETANAATKRPPKVSKSSSEQALKIAERLKAVDAKMYVTIAL